MSHHSSSLDIHPPEQAESHLLLQQRQHFEGAIVELQDELQRAHQQLKANTERAAKMRMHHEKEKKGLMAQAQHFGSTLDGVASEHAAKHNAVGMQHQAELSEMEERLQQQAFAHEDQQRRQGSAHESKLQDVDEWCTAEVEAVRRHSCLSIQAADAKAAHW
ncbi:MAG: hypothetical protein WDW38_002927 [Sanguina aurantia]